MAVEAGVPVSRLRSSVYRRLYWGLYVTADTPDTLHLRCAAALLLVPKKAAVSHTSALALTGLAVDRDGAVHVCVPAPESAPRSREGLAVHRSLVPFEASMLQGLRVTPPARTLLDVAPGLTDDEIVVVADHLARLAGGVASLRRGVETAARHRAARRVRRALGRARDGVDSPQETRLRLGIVAYGLPEPDVAVVVRDRHREWLGVVELGYRRHRVLIQYEGDLHRTSRRRWRQDIARDEAYIAEGWRVLRATADDVERPARFCHRLQQVLEQAAS